MLNGDVWLEWRGRKGMQVGVRSDQKEVGNNVDKETRKHRGNIINHYCHARAIEKGEKVLWWKSKIRNKLL